MNILVLNWRDIKNPLSGGAEILTHEIAKRIVASGNHVLLFSSDFPGASNKEIIDGVEIIRQGKADIRSFINSVHFKAFLFYQKCLYGKWVCTGLDDYGNDFQNW